VRGRVGGKDWALSRWELRSASGGMSKLQQRRETSPRSSE
jgi:hypothetical protein